MCGIAGILDLTGHNAVRPEIVRQMTKNLIHRGPDGEGTFTDGPLGFGFQRLAIIDLATGDQPMSSACQNGRYVIIFNGEIYNFPELRRTLEQKGHPFATKSDTEVILHLFEDKQEKCLDDLIGMFALAIWDKKERRLFVARDRLGKKPLYYGVFNGQFVFGSEIKALAKHPDFQAEIDPKALDLYLTYQAVPTPLTIYKNVRRLPPASFLWIDAAKGPGEPVPYWRLNYTPKFSGNVEEAKERLLGILETVTRGRLISDVPLGAFLSGGIDSSAVVAMMARASSSPVKTFTIGFNEKNFSEAEYGRMVAEQYGCDHTEFTVQSNMLEALPKILWHYDQPFADPSAVPSYYVARETRRAVTVALNGDGGDEAFGGYLRYSGDHLNMVINQWLPAGLSRPIFKTLGHLPANLAKPLNYLRRFGQALENDVYETNYRLFCYFDLAQKRELYSAEWLNRISQPIGREHLDRLSQNGNASHPLDKIFAADYRGYLPDCLLVKMDIASMANSLEARSPFLDHRLAEFAASLPVEWKIKGLTTKWILKTALEEKKILPPAITRRRKMGFGAPVGRWLKEDFKDFTRSTILNPKAINRGYFKKEAVERLITEHQTGKENHDYRLWALLCLELWHQIFIDKTLKPSDTLTTAK
ncbi:MAG: asparagine synthase (glutamine-hydrolyzing) [Elusimicrobia bacterium]|nr:asparagine synthase (glutamine-hydrolyzing) [Elusimicrobiota bacterium]